MQRLSDADDIRTGIIECRLLGWFDAIVNIGSRCGVGDLLGAGISSNYVIKMPAQVHAGLAIAAAGVPRQFVVIA